VVVGIERGGGAVWLVGAIVDFLITEGTLGTGGGHYESLD
jgi:hypothetical protein